MRYVDDSRVYYYDLLNKLKPLIKLNYFCKKVGINQAILSKAMSDKAFYNFISEEKLSRLISCINSELFEILE